MDKAERDGLKAAQRCFQQILKHTRQNTARAEEIYCNVEMESRKTIHNAIFNLVFNIEQKWAGLGLNEFCSLKAFRKEGN